MYQIIAGERRYRAAKAAGLKTIPCIVDEQPSGMAPERKHLLLEGIVENWQRADLKPFELADALIELRDQHGLTQDEIATLDRQAEGRDLEVHVHAAHRPRPSTGTAGG